MLIKRVISSIKVETEICGIMTNTAYEYKNRGKSADRLPAAIRFAIYNRIILLRYLQLPRAE